MATQRLGKIVPLFKGAYDATKIYELNDIVTYNGAAYWHKTTQMTKDIAPSNDSIWSVLFETEALMPQFKGEYSAETEYKINNIVKYENSLYWHVGSEPTTGIDVTNDTVWALAIAGPTL